MSGKRAVLAVLITGICLLVSSCAAQDNKSQDEKNELTGIVGRMFISDQGIVGPNAPTVDPVVRSGHGVTFEVNYARKLFATPVVGISGEIPAVFNLDEKLGSGGDVVPQSYKQVFITPAVRANLFPETAVSLWASVGGGFAHFSESKDLNYYGMNPGSSTTSGVLQGGVGLDLKPFRGRYKSIGFRGQARDFWSGTLDLPLADTGKTRQHNYFVGAGVIWSF
jgi:hypothetical protein